LPHFFGEASELRPWASEARSRPGCSCPAFLLCFTFCFLALNYYISIRVSGRPLSKKQIVVFLFLYIGALDSKEMAVTLPLIVLLHEAIWRRTGIRPPGRLARWAGKEALPALLAGLVTGVYILGKAFRRVAPAPDAAETQPDHGDGLHIHLRRRQA
jgi:hypothetical protein